MNDATPVSSAWQALALICRFRQIPCSIPALQHHFGQSPPDYRVLLAARQLGFKAGFSETAALQCHPASLPALVQTHEGDWHILVRQDAGRLLFHNPAHDLPEWLP
ncbi:MAG: hypothetical protein EP312_02550, partial [Gammaproteobacteria bacterium]